MDNPRTHPALGTIHITKISIAILGFVQMGGGHYDHTVSLSHAMFTKYR
jgi:hypothetical protein